MENVINLIKYSVGAFLVIAICVLMVNVYKKGKNSINESLGEFDRLVEEINSKDYGDYVGKKIKGVDVLDIITSLSADEEIKIIVVNRENMYGEGDIHYTEYTYENTHSLNSTMLKDAKNPEKKERYINPKALFTAEVLYDINSVNTGIRFIQE